MIMRVYLTIYILLFSFSIYKYYLPKSLHLLGYNNEDHSYSWLSRN